MHICSVVHAKWTNVSHTHT